MTAHSVDRQLITAVVRSAVAMGHSLERTASLADMDAIADRLSAVVLAALPTVVVDEDCTASVSLDEVEACCQGNRLSHECDQAAEHRGPHHCGWCSLRFADPYIPEPGCPVFHEVEIDPPGPVQSGVVRTVAPYLCTLPGGHTTSHRDKLGNWWPNAASKCVRLMVADSCRVEYHGHICFLNVAVHEVDGPDARCECSCSYRWATAKAAGARVGGVT